MAGRYKDSYLLEFNDFSQSETTTSPHYNTCSMSTIPLAACGLAPSILGTMKRSSVYYVLLIVQ